MRTFLIIIAVFVFLHGCQKPRPQSHRMQKEVFDDKHRLTTRFGFLIFYDTLRNTHDTLLDGLSESYHANGRLFKRVHYKLGRLHGLETEFDSSGNKRYTINHYEGYRMGDDSVFHIDGRLVGVQSYYYDTLMGLSRGFYANGKPKVSFLWDFGAKPLFIRQWDSITGRAEDAGSPLGQLFIERIERETCKKHGEEEVTHFFCTDSARLGSPRLVLKALSWEGEDYEMQGELFVYLQKKLVLQTPVSKPTPNFWEYPLELEKPGFYQFKMQVKYRKKGEASWQNATSKLEMKMTVP